MNVRFPAALAAVFPLSLSLCGPLPATAATLEPVTVTATRYARPLETTPAHVTVLTEDDLAPLATLPLEDILATQAGVTLARTGGPGQQVSLFLRGTNSDSTLVLIDGMRINGGTFGGANLQHLRGADISRIEVIRGPRATLYGGEAIGGVIAITTRRTADGDRIALHAGGGSDGQAGARVAAATGDAARGISAAAGYRRTDGDPVTDATTIRGRHENRSGTLALHDSSDGGHRYGLDAWSTVGETRYATCTYDAFFNCTGTAPLNQTFREETASLWGELALGKNTQLNARAGHAGSDISQQESADFARTRRLAGTLDLRHHHGGHQLVAGLDAEREDVDAIVYGGAFATVNDLRAVFLRDEWTHGRHQVSAGIRHAHYDSFGEHVTGEASYGLQATDNTYGWLGWGRGFRAPDASERFGFGGNPALAPETADNLEAGLRHRLGAHAFTLAGFVQRINDLIDYPAPSFTATNIARARITGTEIGWSWHADATRLEALVTLLDAVDDGTGDRLSRRPEKQFNANLRHRLGSVEWRAGVLAMDARDNSAFDAVVLPGFAVFDIGAAWQATPALTVDARIENIADRRYFLANGAEGNYLMPDRGIFLAIDWQH